MTTVNYTPADPTLAHRKSKLPDVLKAIATYVPLILISLVTLVPFAFLVSASFKTTDSFFSSMFLPVVEGGYFWQIDTDAIVLDHYGKLILSDGPVSQWIRDSAFGRWAFSEDFELAGDISFGRSVANSFFISSTAALLSTLGAAMGGYALAKFRFAGREPMVWLVLAALVIPGTLLLAPGYQLLYNLSLLDSYTGLILPGLAPAFGVYLFRAAMLRGVPDELLEAARIDGAGEVRTFFQIALPIVRPMIGAFVLITFLAMWNNYINAQIVLQSPEKLPLSVAIAQLKGTQSQDYGLLMAGTLISIAPVLILFLLLQREFIAGLTAGAVKG